MGLITIEVDEELLTRTMRWYNLSSEREAVDLALRRLVGEALSVEEALALEGSGWRGDFLEMRSTRPTLISPSDAHRSE